MDQLIYFTKAQKAYHEKDYRRCLILLKHTPLNDSNSITLYVNACYSAWLSRDPSFSLEEIQASYSALFNSTQGSLIPSYEFVKLSHIYLSYGLLTNALKILQYAGYNGHYDQSIIIIQTWSVLKYLNNANETKRFFYHLCDLLPMEIPETHPPNNDIPFLSHTDIPLGICYLFVGYYLQIESKLHQSKELLNKSHAMIIEAYTFTFQAHPRNKLIYLAWMNKSQTWSEIGSYLEQTPCLLLAEEAHWIAYLYEPLSNERVESCLRVLDEHKRSSERYSLCEKMYQWCHWNILCRQQLLELNYDKYHPLFQNQFIKCRKIQALFRGYQTREHWERTYLRIKRINEIYQTNIQKANKMRIIQLKKLFRSQFRLWARNAHDLRLLKQSSALTIQTNYRGYHARVLKSSLKRRCVEANRKYLIACELHTSFHLGQLLRAWNSQWFQTRNKRCVELIKTFLHTSSWQVKLKRAGVKLHKLLEIKRRYGNRRTFARWYKAYQIKLSKRAFTTIRFWMRRKIRKKKRVPVGRTTSQLKFLENHPHLHRICFKLDKVYQNKYWKHWKEVYKIRLIEHSKERIATQLPRLFNYRKLKLKLNHLRAKREFISSYLVKKRAVTLANSFVSWRSLQATLQIQRALRIFLSKCRLRRRVYQLRRVEYLFQRCLIQARNSCYRIWRENIRKQQLIKQKAVKKILIWYQKRNCHSLLSRFCQRKHYLLKFLELLAEYHLRKAFGQLTRMIFAQKMTHSLSNVMKIFEKSVKRKWFKYFIRQCREQRTMSCLNKRWLSGQVNRKIFPSSRREGWRYYSCNGCYTSDFIQLVYDPQRGGQGGGRGQGRGYEISTLSQLFPILQSRHSNKKLFSLTFLKLNKAFQSWTGLMRYRALLRINLPFLLSSRLCQRMMNKVSQSYQYCRLIQSTIRRYLSKKRYWTLLQRHYKTTEIISLIQSRHHQHILSQAYTLLHHSMRRRCEARVTLQCWFRGLLSHHQFSSQKILLSSLQSKEQIVTSRTNQKKLKSLMRLIQFYSISRSCELAPLSSLPPSSSLSPSSSVSPSLLHPSSTSLSSSLELYHLHYQSIKKPPLKIDTILKRVSQIKKGSPQHDFISPEYHHHLFTIRQHGIFIYNSLTSLLKYNEVIYLIQNTSILFIENLSNTSDILSDLITYFQGKKLILCGGFLSQQNFHHFLSLLLTREHLLTLHLDGVLIKYSPHCIQFARCLSANLCTKLFELSVDVKSVGILGFCSILVSLKDNRSLKHFIVKLTSSSFLPCMEDCFKTLVRNSSLQEIRIFGSPIPGYVIDALFYSLQHGLCNLTTLDFDYQTRDKARVEELKEFCQSRVKKQIGYDVEMRVTEYGEDNHLISC